MKKKLFSTNGKRFAVAISTYTTGYPPVNYPYHTAFNE